MTSFFKRKKEVQTGNHYIAVISIKKVTTDKQGLCRSHTIDYYSGLVTENTAEKLQALAKAVPGLTALKDR